MREIVHIKQMDFAACGLCLQTFRELRLRFGQAVAVVQA
jgi:hypothetical protein